MQGGGRRRRSELTEGDSGKRGGEAVGQDGYRRGRSELTGGDSGKRGEKAEEQTWERMGGRMEGTD